MKMVWGSGLFDLDCVIVSGTSDADGLAVEAVISDRDLRDLIVDDQSVGVGGQFSLGASVREETRAASISAPVLAVLVKYGRGSNRCIDQVLSHEGGRV